MGRLVPPGPRLVQRFQRLVPTLDRSERAVGIGGSDEGLGFIVVLSYVSLDGSKPRDGGTECAALGTLIGDLVSIGLRHQEVVGVKWNDQRGWRWRQAPISGRSCVTWLSRTSMTT